MTKTKLSLILDSIIITFSIFIISFAWLRRITKNAILSFFVSILISVLLIFVIILYMLNNYKTHNNKIFISQNNKKLGLYFKYLEHEKYVDYFCKLLSAKCLNGYIFETNNTDYYINLKTELNDSDFTIFFNHATKNTNKTYAIICDQFNQNFKNCLANSPINFFLFDSLNLFDIIQATNSQEINELLKTKTFKQKVIDKKNLYLSHISKEYFKNFFFSGISLLTLSFFMPFSLSYIIFGSLLLVLSVVCLIKNNSTDKIKNNISLSSLLKK